MALHTHPGKINRPVISQCQDVQNCSGKPKSKRMRCLSTTFSRPLDKIKRETPYSGANTTLVLVLL